MNRYSFLIMGGVLATALSTGVLAQTASTDKPADKPKAIGVSQETADKANSKAKESGDVATVVRTGPTAGERASATADKVGDKASATANKVTDKTKKTMDKTRDNDMTKPSTATPKP